MLGEPGRSVGERMNQSLYGAVIARRRRRKELFVHKPKPATVRRSVAGIVRRSVAGIVRCVVGRIT